MANPKTNTAILGIIAAALIVIAGVLIYKNFIEKTPEEQMAESINETIENIGNTVNKELGGK